MNTKKKSNMKVQPKGKSATTNIHDNKTYKGELPSIVGRYRLLVRASGKESFIYVHKKDIPAIQAKYGADFLRNCGVVKTDHKALLSR